MQLLGLLVPVDEVLAPLLSIDLKEVGVEVCRIGGKRIVTPKTGVLIVDRSDEVFVVLITVHLKLFRKRGLNSSLQKFNLIAVVGIIIKDLPLLDCTFVHGNTLLTDAFRTDDLFNPVLVLT